MLFINDRDFNFFASHCHTGTNFVWIEDLVSDGFLWAQAEWLERLPALQDDCLARLEVPDGREESEKSCDEYPLAHLVHHERVGQRNQTKEASLATLLREQTII